MRSVVLLVAMGLFFPMNCATGKPNVLFIAVDDLNDWVGCLGGHPQARTPYIDALAKKGTLFEQAYCAAPLCSPSRTSVMMGLRPSTTGIYGNLNWFRDMKPYRSWVTLPQYFRLHGYISWGGGKLYHQPKGKFSDPASWDRQYSINMGTPHPPADQQYQHGLKKEFSNTILARLIDWAPIEQSLRETADWRTAEGAARFLMQDHEKAFFLGCGIYLPHLPWYLPQEYFEIHPLESIRLPAYRSNDFEDIPEAGRRMAANAGDIIRSSGRWKEAVQGCLAAGSFADACVGHVLGALKQSRYADNTIVVLWGDHGYDLGEKKFAKSALWEQHTRTPLIIHLPKTLGGNPDAGPCGRPVSLLDLYPTLLDLCGLPPNPKTEGRSIAPLVRNPEAEWSYPAVITHSPHWHGPNHAVRSESFHYIHYGRGGEELYDMAEDPNQWQNLAGDPKYDDVKADLRKWLPESNAPHFRAK